MPGLVALTDIFMFLWIMQLGLQRIAADSYPCLLNLWSGFIGVIVLFNTYLWRCWVLYFTFELTQERLKGTKKSESRFIKHRYLVSPSFALRFMGTLSVWLLLPCGILTASDRAIPELAGDDCDRKWGDYVLSLYMAGYFFTFAFFTYKLRQVVEGFMIKQEMFWTATLGVLFIPWMLFNTSFESANNDIFPFSTLCLVMGVALQFGISTIWPLWKSLEPPAMDEVTGAPADVSTLAGLLSSKLGVASFKKFLTKEFSVENILFYEEIEEYRRQKAAGREELDLIGEAQRIYAKYIIIDSPFQVNLPQTIVKELDSRLRNIFSQSPQEVMPAEAPLDPNYVPPATPTLFDLAQANIFKLMNTDSFPRYQRSDEYRKFVEDVNQKQHVADILEEEGLVANPNQ